MKEKTSITLSTEVLSGIDKLAGNRHSRSSFIERFLRHYLQVHTRPEAHACDLDRLNRGARRLNAEAEDVMEYQGMDLSSVGDDTSE